MSHKLKKSSSYYGFPVTISLAREISWFSRPSLVVDYVISVSQASSKEMRWTEKFHLTSHRASLPPFSSHPWYQSVHGILSLRLVVLSDASNRDTCFISAVWTLLACSFSHNPCSSPFGGISNRKRPLEIWRRLHFQERRLSNWVLTLKRKEARKLWCLVKRESCWD